VVIGENLPATLAPQQVVQVTGANVEFTDVREAQSVMLFIFLRPSRELFIKKPKLRFQLDFTHKKST
jgi:hypothetical protein